MSSNEKEYKVTGVAKMVKPYICGGSAAMFASSCIHPIDLIKVRLQLVGMGSATGKRPSAFGVAKMVVKEEENYTHNIKRIVKSRKD